jgi:hypothetical protein
MAAHDVAEARVLAEKAHALRRTSAVTEAWAKAIYDAKLAHLAGDDDRASAILEPFRSFVFTLRGASLADVIRTTKAWLGMN